MSTAGRAERVLVPVEDLGLLHVAVAQARGLLAHAEAELLLLGIVPPRSDAAAQATLGRALEEQCQELNGAGLRAFSRVVSGRAADLVIDHASLFRATLVVLVAEAAWGPGGWAPGRETVRLLFSSPVPLLLLAGATQARPVRRVLVPLDGSERARRVVDLVEPFARAQAAEVVLLRVERVRLGDLPVALPAGRLLELEASLRPARERLERAGVRVAVRVEEDPSEVAAVLRVADEVDADVIALTRRGATSWGEWPFGSVAEALVRRASRPILLQPAPEDAGTGPPPPERPHVTLTAPPPAPAAPVAAREPAPRGGALLIPTDGSPLGDVAATLALRLVPSLAGEVTLLRVLEEPTSALPAEERLAELVAAEEHLRNLAGRLESAGVRAGARVVRGEVAGRILAASREGGVRLIAMTTHGRTGLLRWARGSVAERVLRRADLPLLLVTPGALGAPDPLGPRFERILVADDGSETAAAVLDPVLALARAHGSALTLLGVAPAAAPLRELTARLAPHVTRCEAAGIKATIELSLGGDPAAEILRRAPDTDLVAMGTHGRQGLARAWLGSITEAVLHRLERPLLVARGRE